MPNVLPYRRQTNRFAISSMAVEIRIVPALPEDVLERSKGLRALLITGAMRCVQNMKGSQNEQEQAN
jgi:hypothetical protein